MSMNLVMAGLDHERAPIALRECLAFPRSRVGSACAQIRGRVPGVLGCVLLSTCNRTELYLSCAEGAAPDPAALLCAAAGVEPEELRGYFSVRRGDDAAVHLLEVAGGLRSRIWGEDQILSQVKGAAALAREAGCADPVLETLFRMAASAGKELKTRIRLENVPASAAGRAVEVLEREAGGLFGKKALVIGNGEMGRLAADALRGAGCAVTVTLRSYRHGESVVPAGCAVVPYEARYQCLAGMDLLISATTSPHYTISVEELAGLAHIPPLMADLAIPRDIEPGVGELPGVALYNIDTLGCAPRREIPAEAEALLARHLERFHQWLNYRESLPALEGVKRDIVRRVLTTDDLEGLEAEQIVELAVGRAVDLLSGGLREEISAQGLERCGEIIRTHTRREKNSHDGLSLSAVR